MGTLCDKTQAAATADEPKEQEKEIPIPSFGSKMDDAVSAMEGKYMYLKDIHFLDYVLSLSKFSMDNATLEENYADRPVTYTCHDSFYNEDMSEDAFQIFVDNKICKHKAIYDKVQKNEAEASVFKDILLKLYKRFTDKLKKEDENFAFKKWHALLFGWLYCKGNNITKIKFLFDLFANEAKFAKNSDFTVFQKALYLLASYTLLTVRAMDINGTDDFPNMDNAKIKELLDACQQKDCDNLVQVTDNRFFGEDGSKTYFIEDFKTLFTKANKEESLAFILSAKGVRYLLEKNNV